ncbi:MAG: PilZ domain-containing protein [Spirochaetia bacterium]|nr:PilZ domain-containing protein [Spirochaetia bacterium]
MKENRKFSRYKAILHFAVKNQKTSFNCISYDISKCGVSFLTPEDLILKEKVSISYPPIKFIREGFITSEAVIPNYPKMKKYGVEFEKHMSHEEVIDFLKASETTN